MNKYIQKLIDSYPESVVHLEKNEYLFNEGDTCKFIGVVEGNIRIVSTLFDGKEIIYAEINSGEMFGNNLLFSSTPKYKGDVIAIIDTKVLLISKNNLLDELSSDKDLLSYFLSYQADDALKLNQRIKILSIDSAEERLMYYLSINNGTISFKSVTELAKILSLERETLSRTIRKLIDTNKITKENKQIEVL